MVTIDLFLLCRPILFICHYNTIVTALVNIHLVSFQVLLFQPFIGAKSCTQTFVFRFLYFCMVLNKCLYNLFNVVCFCHGALWLNHWMMAHPQSDVHRVGEWGSYASSIFVGS